MSFFLWILIGLIAGFIASHIVNRRGEGLLLDILLGIVGALLVLLGHKDTMNWVTQEKPGRWSIVVG